MVPLHERQEKSFGKISHEEGSFEKRKADNSFQIFARQIIKF